MENVKIVVGEKNGIESYQLLFKDGKDIISENYRKCDGNYDNYNDFLDRISTKFLNKIIEKEFSNKIIEKGSGEVLEVAIKLYNGYKVTINGLVKMDKIDSGLLEKILINKANKLSEAKKIVLPKSLIN